MYVMFLVNSKSSIQLKKIIPPLVIESMFIPQRNFHLIPGNLILRCLAGNPQRDSGQLDNLDFK